MMSEHKQNPNPIVHTSKKKSSTFNSTSTSTSISSTQLSSEIYSSIDDIFDDELYEEDESDDIGIETGEVGEVEVFNLIRNINDPEHPLTLEQLNVVTLPLIKVSDAGNLVSVNFTPTIPHCSMATLIGLSIRVKLLRSLPGRFRVDVKITPGTHVSEKAVNKQLADKERVAAALENSHLLDVVNKCIAEQ